MKTNIYFRSYLAQFFVELKIFQTKVVEKLETHILCSLTFFDNCAVYEIIWKNDVEWGRQYGPCALHAGYLKLQIHTQVV